MEEATTEKKEEKLSFIMDDEEFLTRKGAMKEMKIGATTLAKEIKCGNIVPYDLRILEGVRTRMDEQPQEEIPA